MFDHGWADAYERAGGDYYPKLQIAVPFTPVPGRRLLAARAGARPGPDRRRRAGGRRSNGLSSAHATFIDRGRGAAVRARRLADPHRQPVPLAQSTAMRSFDDFLAALSSRKRKAIRKERAAALDGLEIVHLTGARPSPRRIGTPSGPSTRTPARANGAGPISPARFFSLLGERMADRILLILALRDGRPIAGALNLIGADALYGRYWGCDRGGAAPPFRALLLSGDRGGDRARPGAGRGGRAGRAQAGPRLSAGADLVRPLYRRSAPRATRSPHYLAAERRAVARRDRGARRTSRPSARAEPLAAARPPARIAAHQHGGVAMRN